MSKKSIVVILVLSVVVTYLSSYINLFTANNSGEYGFPIKYGTSSFFGGSSFSIPSFIIDVFFWFGLISIIWLGLQKLLRNK